MRWAFSLSGHRDARSAVRAAVLAEQAGCDDVWVTEDYLERGAFSLAGAIAGATSRIRIGVGVVNPWTRHPGLIAMEYATLDELSGGRAVLGLGASNARWMDDQLGIPFEHPIDRLYECVRVIRELMTGNRVEHDGRHFHVHAQLAFSPVRPDPPIVVGVKGPRAIAQARTSADGILLSVLSSPPYVAAVRARVGPDVELAAYVALAVDDAAGRARDRLRPTVAAFLGVHGDSEITRTAGLDPDLADELRTGWAAGRPRVDLVTDELVDRFTVCGNHIEAAASWQRFAEAGLDVAIVRDDPEVETEQMLAVASRVAGSE